MRTVVRPWLIAALAAVMLALPAGARGATSPIGAHSMLQLNDPEPFMQTMFSEAAAMGGSSIRLDVAPALVFGAPSQPPDFTGLDEVMALSTEYHLNVVADLFTIPYWIADCPAPAAPAAAARCGTNDLTDYGAMIGQIVAHADPVIRDWEVWNEPDTSAFFDGTPTQYAWMLRTVYDTVKRIDPGDAVLLGGLSSIAGTNWLAQVLAVPGADAAGAFDIANLHERNDLDGLAGDVRWMRGVLAHSGFTGPLWITEHGYPSDPAFQYDANYADGPVSQAAFLRASIPTMLDAGASMVFVTERDNLTAAFASEGVLGGDVADPAVADAQPIPKPAFAAVQTLAGCFLELSRDCPAQAPVATPASLALGTVRFRSSARGTVTVSDPGGEPLQLGTATVTAGGTGESAAVAADTCGTLLEPDQTCAITVALTAVAGGVQSATLSLASDQGTLMVPVQVTVPSVSSLRVRTLARFVPSHLGRHASGAEAVRPRRLVVWLRDPLAAAVRISRVSPSRRGLVIRADRCAHSTLQPGLSCRLTVWWLAGAGRARLTVTGAGAPLGFTLPGRG